MPSIQLCATRRMICLQTTLKRPEGELIRQIDEAMRDDPTSSDWCEQVKEYLEK